MFSVSMFLKLVSYHHVMYDVRKLCLRVIEAKKNNQTLEPSKIENSIFGVKHVAYEKAITYPRCL